VGVILKYPAIGHALVGGIFSPVTDFTMMVEDTSYMFVTGPNVVKVTNETVTEELGRQCTFYKIRVALYFCNDVECLEDVKRLLSYLPQSNKETTHKLPYQTQ
jgi:propionyl-CoA carboxylase beta chain